MGAGRHGGGLSEYGYYGTHLLPLILIAFVCYLPVVYGRQAWRLLPSIGLLALGYLVAFGPLLAWYVRNSQLYFGRGAGALTWDHLPRNWQDLQLMRTTLQPLFAENLLGLSTFRDRGGFWQAPLLLPAEAALLALGVALLIWRWRDPAAFLMLVLGIGTLFVGGTLVHGVRNLQHWTPAFPAIYAALAVPISAWMASASAASQRWVRRLSIGAVIVGLGVLSWRNAALHHPLQPEHDYVRSTICYADTRY